MNTIDDTMNTIDDTMNPIETLREAQEHLRRTIEIIENESCASGVSVDDLQIAIDDIEGILKMLS